MLLNVGLFTVVLVTSSLKVEMQKTELLQYIQGICGSISVLALLVFETF